MNRVSKRGKKLILGDDVKKNNPKNQPPVNKKKEQEKAVVSEAAERKRANREIDHILVQFHGKKSLIQVLPVLVRRCTKAAVKVALERIEKRWDTLSHDDKIFVLQIKDSLEKETS
jgi:hypothetical protein